MKQAAVRCTLYAVRCTPPVPRRGLSCSLVFSLFCVLITSVILIVFMTLIESPSSLSSNLPHFWFIYFSVGLLSSCLMEGHPATPRPGDADGPAQWHAGLESNSRVRLGGPGRSGTDQSHADKPLAHGGPSSTPVRINM